MAERRESDLLDGPQIANIWFVNESEGDVTAIGTDGVNLRITGGGARKCYPAIRGNNARVSTENFDIG